MVFSLVFSRSVALALRHVNQKSFEAPFLQSENGRWAPLVKSSGAVVE